MDYVAIEEKGRMVTVSNANLDATKTPIFFWKEHYMQSFYVLMAEMGKSEMSHKSILTAVRVEFLWVREIVSMVFFLTLPHHQQNPARKP